jgi:hypothetical protein
MSKSKHAKYNDSYDQWDEENIFQNPNTALKRKEKKLTNILRSKNIADLIEIEEQEDNY